MDQLEDGDLQQHRMQLLGQRFTQLASFSDGVEANWLDIFGCVLLSKIGSKMAARCVCQEVSKTIHVASIFFDATIQLVHLRISNLQVHQTSK